MSTQASVLRRFARRVGRVLTDIVAVLLDILTGL